MPLEFSSNPRIEQILTDIALAIAESSSTKGLSALRTLPAVGSSPTTLTSSASSYTDWTGLGTIDVVLPTGKALIVGTARMQAQVGTATDISLKLLFASTSLIEGIFTSVAQYSGANISYVDYIELSPGTYTVKAQIKNSAGVSITYNAASTKFIIIPLP